MHVRNVLTTFFQMEDGGWSREIVHFPKRNKMKKKTLKIMLHIAQYQKQIS